MTTETEHEKARRYLADGRLTIRQFNRAAVVAFVVGEHSGLTYRTEWDPDTGWTCNCISRERLCAHIRALRLVTVAHQEQEPTE